MATASTQNDQESQPLLQSQHLSLSLPPPLSPSSSSSSSSLTLPEEISSLENSLGQFLSGTANLAKHLPTGTVLIFQLLSPILTNSGNCTYINKILTLTLIVTLALACFVLSFTDSFTDPVSGRIRYGIATFKGFRAFDSLPPLPPETATKLRISGMDFVHGVISMLLFDAVSLLDMKVVSCFYPDAIGTMGVFFYVLPMFVGVFGSCVFTIFPTTRNGIGFPVNTK